MLDSSGRVGRLYLPTSFPLVFLTRNFAKTYSRVCWFGSEYRLDCVLILNVPLEVHDKLRVGCCDVFTCSEVKFHPEAHVRAVHLVSGLLVGVSICPHAPKLNTLDSVSSVWAGFTFLVVNCSTKPCLLSIQFPNIQHISTNTFLWLVKWKLWKHMCRADSMTKPVGVWKWCSVGDGQLFLHTLANTSSASRLLLFLKNMQNDECVGAKVKWT